MQQFIQDRILLSIYPGCSIEEAKRKEASIKGCLISITYESEYTGEGGQECYGPERTEILTMGKKGYTEGDDWDVSSEVTTGYNDDYEAFIEIIGLPPTLSRVLTALGGNSSYQSDLCKIRYYYSSGNYDDIKRKLLNSDGTDATLFDQSEETQKAIALLLGWKN